jgi:hypothetical protein
VTNSLLEYWTVDFQGNINVLNKALLSKDVKHFFYISYINGQMLRKQVPHIEVYNGFGFPSLNYGRLGRE